MHFRALDVRAHLDAGDQRVVVVFGCGAARFGDAFRGVVVGQGVILHALRRREVDELGRGQPAVGGGTVRVKVTPAHHRSSTLYPRARSKAPCRCDRRSRSTRS